MPASVPAARRILIAGGTGQIGELLTPALVAAGDEVYGLARSERSAEKVRELGATPGMGDAGFGGVVLRYGGFYGRDTPYSADGALGEMVMKRRLPIVGDGDGRQPFVHLDDAVSATIAAIDRGSGVYNVVDDDSARAS